MSSPDGKTTFAEVPVDTKFFDPESFAVWIKTGDTTADCVSGGNYMCASGPGYFKPDDPVEVG